MIDEKEGGLNKSRDISRRDFLKIIFGSALFFFVAKFNFFKNGKSIRGLKNSSYGAMPYGGFKK